jgi:SAM-dependent methyltransferase
MNMIKIDRIDSGQGFDWGKTSGDYAKYRDIYPDAFYRKIVDLGMCVKGQKVLDLGTGTGVLPRNLYQYGADFVGTDISDNQIHEAVRLSAEKDMKIDYFVSSAEEVNFPDDTFDVILACQCFLYFNRSIVVPNIARMLKPGGKFSTIYMSWVSDESEIAQRSEEMVLKYSPAWTGGGMKRRKLDTPDWSRELFETEHLITYDINVPFTRTGWNGRMRACRGIGASLPEERIREFDREHMDMLNKFAPEKFDVLHYVTMLVLKVKK